MKKGLKLACITCAVSLALAGCNQSNSLVSSTVKTEQAQQVKTYDAKTFLTPPLLWAVVFHQVVIKF